MDLFELRTFEVRPGFLGDFVELLERKGLDVQAATAGNLAGCWTSESGALNRLVQLWRWADWEERRERRQRVLAHPEFGAYSAESRTLVTAMDSQLLIPTRFSALR